MIKNRIKNNSYHAEQKYFFFNNTCSSNWSVIPINQVIISQLTKVKLNYPMFLLPLQVLLSTFPPPRVPNYQPIQLINSS